MTEIWLSMSASVASLGRPFGVTSFCTTLMSRGSTRTCEVAVYCFGIDSAMKLASTTPRIAVTTASQRNAQMVRKMKIGSSKDVCPAL